MSARVEINVYDESDKMVFNATHLLAQGPHSEPRWNFQHALNGAMEFLKDIMLAAALEKK